MRNKYKISLWLASDRKKREINLTDWEELIKEAVKEYNRISLTARNTKEITDIIVEPKTIKVCIESAEQLSTPTLALRAFSKQLAGTEFGKVAAEGNALFRGSFESIEDDTEEDVTAPEMIKLLAELLMSGKKSDGDLIENIKKQLIDWRNGR